MLMDFHSAVLPNGVRVAVSRIPRVQSVTLGIWVGVGSRYEPAARTGISHCIEHMLFKGTRKRSARAISQAIEGRGGYLNAFTQEESTCYYARVTCDQMVRALDVLCDMYLRARFAPPDLEKERKVLIEEIRMYRDQPQYLVQEALLSSLWRGHALGRPITGSPESLDALTRRDLLDFRERAYVPANTVFAFAGNVEPEACARHVERLCASLPKRAPPRFRPVDGGVGQARLAVVAKETEQTNVALGIRLFGRHDRRRYALKLLSAVLGENMSSRLFQSVRERRGLAYSINSGAQLHEECGVLVVSAGLRRNQTARALDLILTEMRRLRETPVGRREFRRARDYVLGQIRLGLESTTHQMMWIGDTLLSYNRFVSPEEAMDALSSVSPEQVRDVARSAFCPRRASLAVVSPALAAGERDRIEDAVRSL